MYTNITYGFLSLLLQNNNGPEHISKIFIGNITEDTNEEMLYDYFCKYGEIDGAYIKTSSKGLKNYNFGFVTFLEESSVQEAVRDGPHEVRIALFVLLLL